MRLLKRHLSNVVYRRMLRDLDTKLAASISITRQAA
jgi:hypothetical protein